LRYIPLLLVVFFLGCEEASVSSGDSSSKTSSSVTTQTSSASSSSSIISEPSCLETFENELFNPILQQCVTCHEPEGVAIDAGATLVLKENDIATNYTTLSKYISSSSDLLLSKPTGVSHQGGTYFSEGSSEYKTLQTWIDKISTSTCKVDEEVVSNADFYKGATLLSLEDTYQKASILFAGVMQTQSELNSVDSESKLQSKLIALMQGENFKEFLMRNANDKLLVKKYMNSNTQATEILGGYHYPTIQTRLDEDVESASVAAQTYSDAVSNGASQSEINNTLEKMNKANERVGNTFLNIQKALATEPLELIADVVMNDRPYGEILTADYMMLNPYSATSYGSTVSFSNMDDAKEFKRGKITGYVFDYLSEDNPITTSAKGYDALPIAGILTSPIFLARYPSTATNKNRARSRAVYKIFLGFDIESLAVRSMDPEELKKSINPGDKSSSCYGCHIVMDPVAGAFYNWGDDGHFKEQGSTDSLPDTYKDASLYQNGDVWYRDNIKAGFETVEMPTVKEYGEVSGETDGLVWLAKQIVEDPRFAEATVAFWWRAIYGETLSNKPTASSDSDYNQKLTIYHQEQSEIAEFSDVFNANNQNLKVMFSQMLMGERFRVSKVDESATATNFKEIGIGRLLTPEELDKKIEATTGYKWAKFWDKTQSELLDDYYMFYGGIDSDSVVDRPTELNTLMSAVIQRMANEMACPLALRELDVDASKRKLFGDIDGRLEPTNSSNILKIKMEIQNLHKKLLGEELALDDEELLATYNLFYEIYNERKNSIRKDKYPIMLYSDASEQYGEFCFTQGILRFDESVWQDGVIDWSKSVTNPSHPSSPESQLGLFYSPEQTMRAWIAVLSYMLNDYRYIVE